MAKKAARADKEERSVKPFLKWAGGKARHVPEIQKLLGARRFRTYAEPFLGGGAVFFALAEEKRFDRALISDSNAELIRCYEGVRADPADVIARVVDYAFPWSEHHYKIVRAELEGELVLATARMIYLNKAGFNGLYRVNKSGLFNVPWGKHKKAPDWNEENLVRCSELLNRYVRLESLDFGDAIHQADLGKGDLVYFDPPYVPSTESRDFTSYTVNGFSEKDQEQLASVYQALVALRVTVIMSQSDTPWVRKRFKGCSMKKLQIRHSISASGDSRTKVGELLIHANL